MKEYITETGYYVLVDENSQIGAKANVQEGEHLVPDWVDISESFDVQSLGELSDYNIHSDYLD